MRMNNVKQPQFTIVGVLCHIAMFALAVSATAQTGPLMQHQNYPSARIQQYEYGGMYDMVPLWFAQHTDFTTMHYNLSPYYWSYTSQSCPSAASRCLMMNSIYVDTLFDTMRYYIYIEPSATNGWYDTEGMFMHWAGNGTTHPARDFRWAGTGASSWGTSNLQYVDAFDGFQFYTVATGSNPPNLVNGITISNGSAPWTDKSACLYQANCSGGGAQIVNGNYLYVGYAMPYDTLNVTLSTHAVGGSVTASYWNGTNWVTTSSKGPLVRTDGTSRFTTSGQIVLTPPPDWQRTTISGTGITTQQASDYGVANPNTSRPMFIVRFYVSGASTAPIVSKLRGDNWYGTYLNITSVDAAVGGTTTYHGNFSSPLGIICSTSTGAAAYVTVLGMPSTGALAWVGAANNGTFTCVSATATTLVLNNGAGVAYTTASPYAPWALMSTTTDNTLNTNCNLAPCNERAWGGLGTNGYLISNEHFKYNPDVTASYIATAKFEYQARVPGGGPGYPISMAPNFQHLDQYTGQLQWVYAKVTDTAQMLKYDATTAGTGNGVMFDNSAYDWTFGSYMYPAGDYNYTDLVPCSWASGPGNCVNPKQRTQVNGTGTGLAWVASMNTGCSTYGCDLYYSLKQTLGNNFIVQCNSSWLSPQVWQACDITMQEGVFPTPGYIRDFLKTSANFYGSFDIERNYANPHNSVWNHGQSDAYLTHGATGYYSVPYPPLFTSGIIPFFNNGMENRSPMNLMVAEYIMQAPPSMGSAWRYSIGFLVNAMGDAYWTLDKANYTTTTTPIYPSQFQISSVDAASGGNTTYHGIFYGGDVNNCWGRAPTYEVGIVGYPTTGALHTNNGVFNCISTTATTMTVDNPAGVAATQEATAQFPYSALVTAPLNSVGVVDSSKLVNGNFVALRDGPQSCFGTNTPCRQVRLCPAGSDYWNGDNTCYDKGEFVWVQVADATHITLGSSGKSQFWAVNNYYPPGSVIENFVHASVSNNWNTPTDTFTGDDWRDVLYWATFFPAVFYDVGVPDTSPLANGTSWQGVGTTVSGTAAANSCARPTTMAPPTYGAPCQPGDRDMTYRTPAQSSFNPDCTTHTCAPYMTRHYMRSDGKQVIMLWRPGSAGDWVSEASNLGRPIDLQSGPISSGGENMNGPFQQLFADGRLGTPLHSCIADGVTCAVGSGIPYGHQVIQLRAVEGAVLVQAGTTAHVPTGAGVQSGMGIKIN